MRCLVEAGIDPQRRGRSTGWLPSEKAARSGYDALAAYLREREAAVEAEEAEAETARRARNEKRR